MSDSWKKKYSEYTRAVDCVFGWVTCICWEHRMVWWIVGALCCMNKTGRSFASLHFTPRGWGWGCRGTNTCRSSPHPVMDWKWTVVAVELLSHVWLFVTPWTVVCQVPLPMGFPRQEYWSGVPFPPPGDLPNSGIEPLSPALAGRFFTTEPPGKPWKWNPNALIYLSLR